MTQFSLVSDGAAEELERLLTGATVTDCSVKKDSSGASRAAVTLVFDNGVQVSFSAKPLQNFLVSSDSNPLPQFISAGGVEPPPVPSPGA